MSKVYKGYELLKAISEGKIKREAKIYQKDCYPRYRFYTIYGIYRQLHLWREEDGKTDVLIRAIDSEDLLNEFEVEDEDIIDELIVDKIDIDSIEEAEDLFERHNADIDDKLCIQQNRRLINRLIRCLKQHDKEIKELKGRR